jgi:hypothetical protein
VSPVSRRRPSRATRGRAAAAPGAIDAERVRRQPPLDVLGSELLALGGVDDALVVEARMTRIVDVLDPRGPERDPAFERFCRAAVADPRATTSVLGVQALHVLAALGHAGVRDEARAAAEGAGDELRSELPPWAAHLGRVHVVEAGSLRTADRREVVLHVLLDYDDPSAGSRHLLSIAAERVMQRVHLLDVRLRDASDSLAPMAATYSDSVDPTWTWHQASDVADLVARPVRATYEETTTAWTVRDLEGQPTPVWSLGVARLETVTGLTLRVPDDGVALR